MAGPPGAGSTAETWPQAVKRERNKLLHREYGIADDNKENLKIAAGSALEPTRRESNLEAVLQWEAGAWTRNDMDVAPEQIFDQ